MQLNYFLAFILTLLMIVYIIIDIAFNDEMWDTSIKLTKSLQEEEFTGEQLIYEFFSYAIFALPLAAVISFMFMNNKLNALLYLCVTAFSITINEILKSIYHQPRPYMVENSIQGLKCNADYGKPSGHSQNSVVMFVMMPYLLFPELIQLKRVNAKVEEYNQSYNKSKTGYTIETVQPPDDLLIDKQSIFQEQSTLMIILKALLLVFFVFCIGMTGLSRIFLGVHTLGQVILGWSFGLYISFMYILLIHQILYRNLMKILKSKSKRENFNFLIPFQLLQTIILLIIAVALLNLNKHLFVDQEEVNQWIDRINQCSNNKHHYISTSPSILYNGCCITTAIGSVLSSLLIGVIITEGSFEEGSFRRNYNQLSNKKKALRILILIGPLLILIPFLFLKTSSVYIQTFFQMLPIAFIGGFILTYVYPHLLKRFNLEVKGDFLSTVNHNLLSKEVNNNVQITLEYNQLDKKS